MSQPPTRLKSFAYVVRNDRPMPKLLVFDSLDEAGFEVPKGAAEEDETPEQAALREVWEETGVDTGFVYRYRWLDLTPDLFEQLVQGCDAFVSALLQACPDP